MPTRQLRGVVAKKTTTAAPLTAATTMLRFLNHTELALIEHVIDDLLDEEHTHGRVS